MEIGGIDTGLDCLVRFLSTGTTSLVRWAGSYRDR